MPVPIADDWRADGWEVYECDGHDIAALHAALSAAVSDGKPSVVIARTVIGKGVSFMEDEAEFHGRALKAEEYVSAMGELGLDPAALERAKAARATECEVAALDHRTPAIAIDSGDARDYAEKVTDNRSAWGTALTDLAEANPGLPIAVLDCDLAVSVKTDGFAAARPDGFVQCGVGEHNAATTAGALSTVPGVLAFFSDFGAFGIDEVYNQQRLNDINGAALKLVVTHCGLDVGEDGKTHQCLDYVGALRNLFGWKVIVPADPNQTDRAVRAAAAMQGCVAIAMGRSKLPVITDDRGAPLFGGDYRFTYGGIDWARRGDEVCVLAMGTVAGAAVEAVDALRATGVKAGAGLVACPLQLDDRAMAEASAAPLIVTVEDHAVGSGLGCSVAEWLAQRGAGTRLMRIGVDDYQSSGSAAALFARAGLDAPGIERAVLSRALSALGRPRAVSHARVRSGWRPPPLRLVGVRRTQGALRHGLVGAMSLDDASVDVARRARRGCHAQLGQLIQRSSDRERKGGLDRLGELEHPAVDALDLDAHHNRFGGPVEQRRVLEHVGEAHVVERVQDLVAGDVVRAQYQHRSRRVSGVLHRVDDDEPVDSQQQVEDGEPHRARVHDLDILGELVARHQELDGTRSDSLIAHQRVADAHHQNAFGGHGSPFTDEAREWAEESV